MGRRTSCVATSDRWKAAGSSAVPSMVHERGTRSRRPSTAIEPPACACGRRVDRRRTIAGSGMVGGSSDPWRVEAWWRERVLKGETHYAQPCEAPPGPPSTISPAARRATETPPRACPEGRSPIAGTYRDPEPPGSARLLQNGRTASAPRVLDGEKATARIELTGGAGQRPSQSKRARGRNPSWPGTSPGGYPQRYPDAYPATIFTEATGWSEAPSGWPLTTRS